MARYIEGVSSDVLGLGQFEPEPAMRKPGGFFFGCFPYGSSA